MEAGKLIEVLSVAERLKEEFPEVDKVFLHSIKLRQMTNLPFLNT